MLLEGDKEGGEVRQRYNIVAEEAGCSEKKQSAAAAGVEEAEGERDVVERAGLQAERDKGVHKQH